MFNKIEIWVPGSLFVLRCMTSSAADSLETKRLTAMLLLQMREMLDTVYLDQGCWRRREGEQEF